MRKAFCSFFLFHITACAVAQYKVQFVLSGSVDPTQDHIYLAGSFNNWSPANEAYRFRNDTLTLLLKPGAYAYKLTKGSWEKVETDNAGNDVANREFLINTDTVIVITKPAFKSGTAAEKQGTACRHVMLFDSAMYVPQLKRYRRITVHLPPDYQVSKKHYTVLFVHDGQNVFDALRAPFGEWKMDETLDSVFNATGWNPIVVAVDHGGDKRLTEYNTSLHKRFGEAEGHAYLQFLAAVLKPEIDAAFRTLPGRRNTWLAGSSMGGVISTAALLNQSQVFVGAGIFSPAYWTSEPMFNQVRTKQFTRQVYAFIYAGGKEDSSMLPLAQQMFSMLKSKRRVRTELVTDVNGKHNEATWAHYFPLFLHYMRTHTYYR